MEGYHSCAVRGMANPLPSGRREPADVAESLPNTGGCLNPSADVLLTERETQPGLPLIDKGRVDRTAASDLTGLAPRSHSTLNVG